MAKPPKVETTLTTSVPAESVVEPIADINVPPYEWPTGQNVVHILMPVMNGRNPNWATVKALTALFERDKMKLDIHINNFHVRGRNHLVDVFLAGGCRYALFLDDDVVLPFGDVPFFRELTNNPNYPQGFITINPIQRLIAANKDIIAGCYFGRNYWGVAQYAESYSSRLQNQVSHYGPRNLVTETQWVPGGCTLIKREVFLGIAEKFPENRVTDPATRRMIGYSYRYFNPQGEAIDSSEDVAMCNLARKAGYKIFVDHGVFPIHMGEVGYAFSNTHCRPLPV